MFSLPGPLSGAVNSVLVIPDYWVGNTFYKFQSEKKSLVETFIERKLTSDHSDLPTVTDFFDYSETGGEADEKGLFVYFLQEPKSYEIYQRLAGLNIGPQKITTPAFLWNNKIYRYEDQFRESGQCLVHMVGTDCFLYFFDRGSFLFSRSIVLPDSGEGSDDALSALNYEINQSLYLFSQKARTDQIQIHLLSPEPSNAGKLSDLMERDVSDLGDKIQKPMDDETTERLSVISAFDTRDLSPYASFLSLTHTQLKKDLEWKPIQLVGIFIGLIMLTILGVESLFLHRLSLSQNVFMSRSEIQAQAGADEILQRYDESLDLMTREAQRPSLQQSIIKMVKSLPSGIQIRELTVELENGPQLGMKGLVTARNPIHFRNLLAQFLDRLKIYFEGCRNLRIQNIDFEVLENNGNSTLQTYLIQFGFDLP